MLVSACIITYNQEKYIRECLEAAISQRLDYDYEIVIGDDCSTDNTSRICEEYALKYPEIIKYKCYENNLGMLGNWRETMSRCKGKYIALCEGDDYWVDDMKLQSQVDFLEQNEECSFSFHKAFRIKNDKIDPLDVYPNFDKKETIINEQTFLSVATVPTASIVYRSIYKLPDLNHSHCDFMFFCTLLTGGKGGFIDKVMSAYRIHEDGVSFNYKKRQYTIRRIGEIEIEAKHPSFSKSVRDQIKKVLLRQIIFFLNNSRGNLSLKEKLKYFSKVLGQKDFYKLPLKDYLTLAKTLAK